MLRGDWHKTKLKLLVCLHCIQQKSTPHDSHTKRRSSSGNPPQPFSLVRPSSARLDASLHITPLELKANWRNEHGEQADWISAGVSAGFCPTVSSSETRSRKNCRSTKGGGCR